MGLQTAPDFQGQCLRSTEVPRTPLDRKVRHSECFYRFITLQQDSDAVQIVCYSVVQSTGKRPRFSPRPYDSAWALIHGLIIARGVYNKPFTRTLC